MQEIQEALSKSGFPVEATGLLDAPTVDALKRFQEKQRLEPTGKLSSLTLIGLGLGPAQEIAVEQANPPARKDETQP
ncbi:MAG: peptidoglycan-binding protein [Bryobacterales bacterium]|nr:peptidoglycan-binding protein [Bryobacterales bacterium]